MPNDLFNPRSLYSSCLGRLPLDKCELSYKRAAELRNNDSFMFWFNYLTQRALSSRYDLVDMPVHCDKRLALQSLLWGCQLALVVTPVGIKAFQGMTGSGITETGYTTDGMAYTCNGDVLPLKLYVPGEPDYVPEAGPGEYVACMIYENFEVIPFSLTVMELAAQLADTWVKMGVARRNAAVPFVFASDEQGVPSIVRALRQRDNNQEAVVLDFGFDISKGTAFPIQDAVKGMGAFESHIEYLLNKFDTMCGIPNNPVVRKKERVNSSEIEASEGSAAAAIENTMESLQYYIDQANAALGTSIKVERRDYQNGDVRDMGEETRP